MASRGPARPRLRRRLADRNNPWRKAHRKPQGRGSAVTCEGQGQPSSSLTGCPPGRRPPVVQSSASPWFAVLALRARANTNCARDASSESRHALRRRRCLSPWRDRARSADRARVAAGDAHARIEIGMGCDAPIETQGRDDLGPVGVDRSDSSARTLATAIEATRQKLMLIFASPTYS